jgi:hypothetical protein
LEHADGLLWQQELVLLRLNKAIQKRKGTTLLGHRIATQLQAHVVQAKGHTVVLYRPSMTPVIDIDSIASSSSSSSNDEIDDDDENGDEIETLNIEK